jgi:hypothetical protein
MTLKRKGLFTLLFLLLGTGMLISGKIGLSASTTPQVQLRKFPYPYQAMLSFASDIDGTTPEEFVQYHRFLNTKENTPMGKGLGLDVGDSFWMYMATDSSHPYYVDNKKHTAGAIMTYFSGINPHKKKDAQLIRHYWRAGWIDSIHGYGDFSRVNRKEGLCKRDLAKAAWAEMNRAGIHPEIWINHGNEANKQNFGAYTPVGFASYQDGDNKHSPFYHTDLAIKNGVHFVWNSRGEATFGQDSAIFPIKLRDRSKIWGFHRYTFDYGKHGLNWTWGPKALHIQLTPKRLEKLVAKKQYVIIAQHFGGENSAYPFTSENIKALRLLADYQNNGRILVTRTSRLLHYNLAQKYLNYSVVNKRGTIQIHLRTINDPLFGSHPITLNDVRGITFYVPDPQKAEIFIGEHRLDSQDIRRNPPDQTGKPSIGITWFSPDTFDYSKTAPHTPSF